MFIYMMIVNFGSLMCSIVTTTRKFFTVLASVVLFSHTMSNQQMVGAALVFTGLMADQLFGKKHGGGAASSSSPGTGTRPSGRIAPSTSHDNGTRTTRSDSKKRK